MKETREEDKMEQPYVIVSYDPNNIKNTGIVESNIFTEYGDYKLYVTVANAALKAAEKISGIHGSSLEVRLIVGSPTPNEIRRNFLSDLSS